MAASVMGDGPEPVGGHEEQLGIPGVGVERPAVTEDDGTAEAPVLVEDFGPVSRLDGGHLSVPFVKSG